ncbi:DUF924 family protein [Chelativorans sp. AA-79]|uniref:DUF924 family protein n=1 Tax=Chelativorans sp. AA-79 TaxID=3028735 RepID=UPI0023F6462F|nr:DUF924 family protein [Chelativorans sp. AA-79]WEX11389.1 DUF924 domain-containing protein [Chelativorans sp. AA-79]
MSPMDASTDGASAALREWDVVLDFWFPEGRDLSIDATIHNEYWMWRMRGGADAEIIARFPEVTESAVRGDFEHWADDPYGRLALIIVLDQFPRSLWRDTPRAFAQDGKALTLALEGYENGHYGALETPWHKTVYNLPLVHCEGPDHLERVARAIGLAQEILSDAPAHLKPGYQFAAEQPVEAGKVIAAFGRHPHRNAVLGRESTPEEAAYIAKGRFPHLRMPQALS